MAKTKKPRRSGTQAKYKRPKPPKLNPYERRGRNLEDYYHRFDMREGYCWCGCGEITNVVKVNEPKNGVFAGEHRAFMRGHVSRCAKKPQTSAQRDLYNKLPPEKPAQLTDEEWNVTLLHCQELLPYTVVAERLEMSLPSAKYKGKVAHAVLMGRGRPTRQAIPTPYKQGDFVYGELGELDDDGETVMCHVCGKRFAFLGLHVVKAHDMSVDEYREAFGLMQKTSLTSEALKEKHRTEDQLAHLAHYRHNGTEFLRNMPLEERLSYLQGREVRLEQQNKPEYQKWLSNFIEAGQAKLAALRVRGEIPVRHFTPEEGARGRKRFSEVIKDPDKKREWREKISQGRGGVTMRRKVCPVCATAFEVRAGSKKKLCSEDCRKTFRWEILKARTEGKV